MQRQQQRIRWAAALIALFGSASSTQAADPWTQVDSIKSAVKAVQTQWIKDHPNPIANTWNPAVYHIGAMEVWKRTKDSATLAYSKAWADNHNWAPANATTSHPDDMNCGNAYADLLAAGAKPATPTAFEKNLDGVFKTHATDTWEIVDYLFMSMPMWVKWSKIKKDSTYANYILPLWTNNWQTRKLWDSANGLYFRDKNWFYPAVKSKNGKPVFWSRGDGWAFAAHARTLEELSATSSLRPPLLDRYLKIAEGIRKAQNGDGFWRASLLDSADVPNPELSGTALDLSAIAWGLRKKLLDQTVWEPVFNKGWKAVWTTARRPGGHLGWCQDVGFAPAPATENFQNDFCTGAFLLAGAETISWLEAKTTSLQPHSVNTPAARVRLQGSTWLMEANGPTHWSLLDATGRTLNSGSGTGTLSIAVPSGSKVVFLRWNGANGSGMQVLPRI